MLIFTGREYCPNRVTAFGHQDAERPVRTGKSDLVGVGTLTVRDCLDRVEWTLLL